MSTETNEQYLSQEEMIEILLNWWKKRNEGSKNKIPQFYLDIMESINIDVQKLKKTVNAEENVRILEHLLYSVWGTPQIFKKFLRKKEIYDPERWEDDVKTFTSDLLSVIDEKMIENAHKKIQKASISIYEIIMRQTQGISDLDLLPQGRRRWFKGLRTRTETILYTIYAFIYPNVIPIFNDRSRQVLSRMFGESKERLRNWRVFSEVYEKYKEKYLREIGRIFPNDPIYLELDAMLNELAELKKDGRDIIELIKQGIIVQESDLAVMAFPPRNIILQGPPGCGKTFLTKYLVKYLDQNNQFDWNFKVSSIRDQGDADSNEIYDVQLESRVKFITFHQEYSYEEFVEGIRINVKEVTSSDGKNNLTQVQNFPVFNVKDGIFKEICNEARKNPSKNYYLIIDEINRGNIARIMGELITLIEEDKREGAMNEQRVILPYSREEFSVPANVFVIGTMNTTDRSLALLDFALRRRFFFIDIYPDPDLIDVEISVQGSSKVTGKDSLKLSTLLTTLNERITQRRGLDFALGHGYFMKGNQPINIIDELAFRWFHQILPQLQEYFYDDPLGLLFVLSGKKEENLGLDSDVPTRERLIPFVKSTTINDGEIVAVHLKNEDDFRDISEFIEELNQLLQG